MMQEVVKFVTAAALLYTTGNSWQSSLAGWSVRTWTVVAGIPAALYVIQNYCSLVAYQNLTPVTYNVLNQTKTLSAAFFCYVFMNKRQSKLQIVALFLLSMAALVLEKVVPLPWVKRKTSREEAVGDDDDDNDDKMHFTSGVLPVLAASAISGMTGVSDMQAIQYMYAYIQ